jgi:hypothetical protein
MKISLTPSSHTSAAYYVYGQEATGNLGVYNVTTGRFYAPIAHIPGGVQLDGRRRHLSEFKNGAGVPSLSQAIDWFWSNGWRKAANACNHDTMTCEDAGYQPATKEENTMPEYQIVTMNEGTGDWNTPIETFLADNDSDANAYAEAHYQAVEWYILNESGENINS